MNNTELLPCPFCGNAPKKKVSKKTYCQLHGEPSQQDVIYCDNSWCNVKPVLSYGITTNPNNKLEAIKAWNTRADKAAPVERIKELAQAIKDLDEDGEIDRHNEEAIEAAARAYLKLQGGD